MAFIGNLGLYLPDALSSNISYLEHFGPTGNTKRISDGFDDHETRLVSVEDKTKAMITAAGSTGAEDGANTWAKIATINISSDFDDINLLLSIISNKQSISMASAIVNIVARRDTAPAGSINTSILSLTGSGLGSDSFKIVSAGYDQNIEVWMQKKADYLNFVIRELSIAKSNSANITYHNAAPWQSAEPTGTYSATSSIILGGVSKDNYITGDNHRGTIGITDGDLDLITKSGFYYANSGTANRPPSETAGGQVIHTNIGSADIHAKQIFMVVNSDEMYHRTKYNNVWASWVKMTLDDVKSVRSHHMVFNDDIYAKWGTDEDFGISHSGSNAYLTSFLNGGDIYIRGYNASAALKNMAVADPDGAFTMYYAGSMKVATKTDGINVVGAVYADGIRLGDNENIYLGNDNDFNIYHDGYNNVIKGQKNGSPTYIQGKDNSSDMKTMIIADPNGSVGLYYAGVNKFQTTSGGIEVTGDIYNDGQLQANTRVSGGVFQYYDGAWKEAGMTLATGATAKMGNSSTSGDSLTSAHSYSGSGILHSVSQLIALNGSGSETGDVRITIDGVSLGTIDASKSEYDAGVLGAMNGSNVLNMPIEFSTSLLIQHQVSAGSDSTVTTTWNYQTT